ncbi:MAG TPA: hypothetical protein VM681_06200, partial [Candidatus Thermoplasmatota archaeon]|nr:hypothetical protein [Candidatus Thermoplasmatota archaeon]
HWAVQASVAVRPLAPGSMVIFSVLQLRPSSHALRTAPAHFGDPVLGAVRKACDEGRSCKTEKITIEPGASGLTATLAWTAQCPPAGGCVPDMDLQIFSPTDKENDAAEGAAATGVQPEVATLARLAPGEWDFRVILFAGQPTSYTLTVDLTYGNQGNNRTAE